MLQNIESKYIETHTKQSVTKYADVSQKILHSFGVGGGMNSKGLITIFIIAVRKIYKVELK